MLDLLDVHVVIIQLSPLPFLAVGKGRRMKRGLHAPWPVVVLATACILLAACSWSPRATGPPPGDDRLPDVTAARHGDHLMQRARFVHEPAPSTAGDGQTVESGGAAESARTVREPSWSPFATVGGVTLLHPASRVERVGFHESNHDGARQLQVHPSAADPITLESRGRGTGSRSAADVVVDPEVEIRAPLTGTVLRSGSYELYCEYSDDFAVIEPRNHPGWEVKVLHIEGVRVSRGDRVEAGVSPLAGRARQLPFRSQVDDYTAEPSWPHVHIEVVDPSVPDRPSPGGGC